MKKFITASLLALPLCVLSQEQASAFFSICGSNCHNYSFQIPRLLIGFDTGVNNNACCPSPCHMGGYGLAPSMPVKGFHGGPAPLPHSAPDPYPAAPVGPAPYPASLAPSAPPLPPISALSVPATVLPATYKTSVQPVAPRMVSAPSPVVMGSVPSYWYNP
jgi:hypothetical protein